MPPADDPRRIELRAWLDANPNPSGRQLAEAGLVAPHLPRPWGLDADPMHQLIIDDELSKAKVKRPRNDIGIGWATPTIIAAGTEEQKERFLPPCLAGEEMWCQLFSEPDAGSDLASLATRAVRDGDEYIVNGSKIWTSGGHHSQYGILIARTDPDVPKHKGISYFICPMDLPGITMTPILDMTTAHSFNQVFFDDVRLPADLLVGQENDGWRLAKVTLANERVSLSRGGVLWGAGPTAEEFFDLVRADETPEGRVKRADPIFRDAAARVHIESEVLRLTRLRTLSSRLHGRTPGPEASIQKFLADEHGQRLMSLAKDWSGADGMVEGSGPSGVLPDSSQTGATEVNFTTDTETMIDRIWHYGYLFSPALTLGGGTFAVQRNIVAEHVLGLPRDINVEKGMSWSESRRA